MSQRKKLLAKARNSPQNVSFSDLETLTAAYGLPLKKGGSHYIQRLPDGTKNVIAREGNTVKKWYVKDVVDAIEMFGTGLDSEDCD